MADLRLAYEESSCKAVVGKFKEQDGILIPIGNLTEVTKDFRRCLLQFCGSPDKKGEKKVNDVLIYSKDGSGHWYKITCERLD